MSEKPKQNPFTGDQLQGTHYQKADMTGANFDGVNLSGAKFYAV